MENYIHEYYLGHYTINHYIITYFWLVKRISFFIFIQFLLPDIRPIKGRFCVRNNLDILQRVFFIISFRVTKIYLIYKNKWRYRFFCYLLSDEDLVFKFLRTWLKTRFSWFVFEIFLKFLETLKERFIVLNQT